MYLIRPWKTLESRKGQGGGWGKKVGARGVGGDSLGETALLLLPPDWESAWGRVALRERWLMATWCEREHLYCVLVLLTEVTVVLVTAVPALSLTLSHILSKCKKVCSLHKHISPVQTVHLDGQGWESPHVWTAPSWACPHWGLPTQQQCREGAGAGGAGVSINSNENIGKLIKQTIERCHHYYQTTLRIWTIVVPRPGPTPRSLPAMSVRTSTCTRPSLTRSTATLILILIFPFNQCISNCQISHSQCYL